VDAFALAVSLSVGLVSQGMFCGASSSGIHQELTRTAGHESSGDRDKEAWYMAWIVVVPPFPATRTSAIRPAIRRASGSAPPASSPTATPSSASSALC